MKKVVLILLFAATAGVLFATDDGARVSLVDKCADMGEMFANEIHTDTVRITNIGTAPLVIQNVFSSCRCTMADFPREPLSPGDTARIVVTFDAANRMQGQFRKLLRIRSNAINSNVPLIVKGSVRGL